MRAFLPLRTSYLENFHNSRSPRRSAKGSLGLFVIELELRVPVRAATFRRQIQHQPKRVEVWSTARILSWVGHRTAQFSAIRYRSGESFRYAG
jgi:hypothetical protein